jgi:hypothetical protein
LKRLSPALDRIGLTGSLVAAALAPCCFPIFAAVGTVAGLTALGPYEGIILYIFQGFALLTLVGLALSFRQHHDTAPLIIGTLGCTALTYHFYWEFSLPALYSGLLGLIAATLWNYVRTRARRPPVLQSVVTCPHCGHKSEETMPTDVCLFFYDCLACKTKMKPKEGDCCVFCSFGSVPCPPIQAGKCGA